jgi:hypothetical protein
VSCVERSCSQDKRKRQKQRLSACTCKYKVPQIHALPLPTHMSALVLSVLACPLWVHSDVRNHPPCPHMSDKALCAIDKVHEGVQCF